MRTKKNAIRNIPIDNAKTGLGKGRIACCKYPRAKAYNMSESTIPDYCLIYLAMNPQPEQFMQ